MQKNLLGFTLIAFQAFGLPASANCADSIGSLAFAQPIMARYWQEITSQSTFPWGKDNPFTALKEDQIWLSPVFESMNGPDKLKVLDYLYLFHREKNWYSLVLKYMSESELEVRLHEVGALHPYSVYASDGRLIAAAYDGCTRNILLTERDRYQWYLNRFVATGEALYNAGHPAWRNVKFPLQPSKEKALRQTFWKKVGYHQANQGWWIAWVPEQGYFEINLPNNKSLPELKQRFLKQAPQNFRYVIVDHAGNVLPWI
jgi:hypothetical protein